MNERLATLARNQRGVFTRAQAVGCGYEDEDLYRAVRAGRWRGTYVEAAASDGLDDTGRHLARVHAVALSLTGSAGPTSTTPPVRLTASVVPVNATSAAGIPSRLPTHLGR